MDRVLSAPGRGVRGARRLAVAHVQSGLSVRSPQWWVHLRPYWKRRFWKRQRKAFRRELRLIQTDARGAAGCGR